MRLIGGLLCIGLLVIGLGCKGQQAETEVGGEGGLQPVGEIAEPAPELEPSPELTSPETTLPGVGETTYVVQRGDTLYGIARRLYGDGKLWEVIFNANRDRVSSPTQLKVGTELRIPARP